VLMGDGVGGLGVCGCERRGNGGALAEREGEGERHFREMRRERSLDVWRGNIEAEVIINGRACLSPPALKKNHSVSFLGLLCAIYLCLGNVWPPVYFVGGSETWVWYGIVDVETLV